MNEKTFRRRILSYNKVYEWNKAILYAFAGLCFAFVVWVCFTIGFCLCFPTNYINQYTTISKLCFFVIFLLYAFYISYKIKYRNIFYIIAAIIAFMSYFDSQNRYFTPFNSIIIWILKFFGNSGVYDLTKDLIGNAFSEGIVVWLAIDAGLQGFLTKPNDWERYILVIYNTVVNQMVYLDALGDTIDFEITRNDIQSSELIKFCKKRVDKKLPKEDRDYYEKLIEIFDELQCETKAVNAKQYLLHLRQAKLLLEKSDIICKDFSV